jgi:hypothetical protein
MPEAPVFIRFLPGPPALNVIEINNMTSNLTPLEAANATELDIVMRTHTPP